MRRALLAAGAVLIFAAPALADEVTIDKKTTTTTTTTTPAYGSTESTVVLAPVAPPPVRVEAPPPVPGPGMAWIPGHWVWRGEDRGYVWLHGRYAEPPRARAAWIAGRFVQRPGGWMWVEGHWD